MHALTVHAATLQLDCLLVCHSCLRTTLCTIPLVA
jgi:hypothetical protein